MSPFFDWTYAQMGDTQGEGPDYGQTIFGDPARGGYGLLAFKKDILVGANLINCTGIAGLLRRAIMGKTQKTNCLDARNSTITAESLESSLRSVTSIDRKSARVALHARGL
jgi:hypothetical protein